MILDAPERKAWERFCNLARVAAYTVISKQKEGDNLEKYFAASNSAHGFCNYYNECFSSADKLYIIKGGPGTGKSGFMRRCAALAKNKGYHVEYFYCSSDPDSLDGILIHSSKIIAVIDGTAPHSYEMVYPGVRDNIINLGEAWDESVLDKYRAEIFRLCEGKTLEYRRTYDATGMCGNLFAVISSYVNKLIIGDKLESFAAKLTGKLDARGCGHVGIRLIDSLSMKGCVRFDTFERMADRCVVVGDTYGAGHIMLDKIRRQLDLRSCDYYISYDPIIPNKINGIFERGGRVAFVLSDPRIMLDIDADRIEHINMRRFIRAEASEVKADLKYTFSLYRSGIELAQRHLARAAGHHFALEEIYKEAMDFDVVNKMTDSFCKKIL